MTDRIRTLTVVLDRDFRTDDLEAIIRTIMGLKHVVDVQPGPVVNVDQYIARADFRATVLLDLMKILRLYASPNLSPKEGEIQEAIAAQLQRLKT